MAFIWKISEIQKWRSKYSLKVPVVKILQRKFHSNHLKEFWKLKKNATEFSEIYLFLFTIRKNDNISMNGKDKGNIF